MRCHPDLRVSRVTTSVQQGAEDAGAGAASSPSVDRHGQLGVFPLLPISAVGCQVFPWLDRNVRLAYKLFYFVFQRLFGAPCGLFPVLLARKIGSALGAKCPLLVRL